MTSGTWITLVLLLIALALYACYCSHKSDFGASGY